MGQSLTKFYYKYIERQKNKNIIFLGLDSSGKTTILYQLKLGEVVTTIPTFGINQENVKFKNHLFQFWDLSGSENLRKLWKTYDINIQAIIFVVDSYDEQRIDLAKTVFQSLLDDQSIQDIPILILANKQDIKRMDLAYITEKLELHKIEDRQWYIQPCTALNQQEITEGLNWLYLTMNLNDIK
ncbi:P-loop containing nucleoside triphosphate hydrolase [Pseudocohnilembus persalinus]|uniref:p-loop containing nucleoside triphosphate hydrolase n=1 Tax=Pseudocohnilembus persalinus TaxID=266149 RepID=A0A0V0R7B1_PSEPJ|nr:P-loop containing nucleoside triphosphate hydrolase [Pseudocohnilembus persalinus]|eukprot:KRX10383.1 P-loop containing nucleoside triphosphate hydrolase [Pseudocohnilembus persalinus]